MKPAFLQWAMESFQTKKKLNYKIVGATEDRIRDIMQYPNNENQQKDFLLDLIASTKSTSNLFLLVLVDNKIVGQFVFVVEDNEGSIADIHILNKYWGYGIGTTLVQTAISVAKTNKLKKIWLAVLKDNYHAQELYERMGFKKIPHHKKETTARWIYELQMSALES